MTLTLSYNPDCDHSYPQYFGTGPLMIYFYYFANTMFRLAKIAFSFTILFLDQYTNISNRILGAVLPMHSVFCKITQVLISSTCSPPSCLSFMISSHHSSSVDLRLLAIIHQDVEGWRRIPRTRKLESRMD